MGLISLYLFTMLGGLAAGTYVFETCFCRKRKEGRPWLVPLAVVILFAVAIIAAATHISSIPRAFGSVFAGTVNFGAGMTQEVVISVCFLVLAVIDLIITLVRKDSPFALRVVTAVVAVAAMFMMGMAYVDVLGVPAWNNGLATVLAFLAGDLAMGLGLYAVLDGASFAENQGLRITALVVNAVLAVALILEIAAFSGCGEDIVGQVVGLVVAPVVSLIVAAMAPKVKGSTAAIVICVASIVGVAIARYAFYAICTVL